MKTHHAVVFEGDAKRGLEHIETHAQETLNISRHKNPDFEVFEYERFTIKHARALKERAGQAPLQDIQVFVIVTEAILREAQNALLKLLEEPAEGTYFYILIPSVRSLLPTVRSRLSFGGTIAEEDTSSNLVQKFLLANTAERIALLESCISEKDRGEARKFLQSLERHLHNEGVVKNASSLKEVYLARQYIGDRSSSVKMLLEHVIASV